LRALNRLTGGDAAEQDASHIWRIAGTLNWPTEAKIAQLVAGGRTNKEVAAQLFVSVKTVEANLSRIYAKLSLRSRSELAARMPLAK